MKTLAIIGSDGMMGSDLVRYLSKNFQIVTINKENYNSYVGKMFDIVINANGNSKRFWANQNPVDDFFASTVSVMKSVFDFPCKLYSYISSADVYENHRNPAHTKENIEINPANLQAYGLHKFLSELIIKKYKEKFLILRLSMVLGTNLKKGPLYDITHNNPLYITLNTQLQLITTRALSEIVEIFLENKLANEIINIGGTGTFSFTEIHKYFDQEIKISPQAEKQIYHMDIEKLKKFYPTLKTSEEYLKEFLTV